MKYIFLILNLFLCFALNAQTTPAVQTGSVRYSITCLDNVNVKGKWAQGYQKQDITNLSAILITEGGTKRYFIKPCRIKTAGRFITVQGVAGRSMTITAARAGMTSGALDSFLIECNSGLYSSSINANIYTTSGTLATPTIITQAGNSLTLQDGLPSMRIEDGRTYQFSEDSLINQMSGYGNFAIFPIIDFRKADGTIASPTAASNDRKLGRIGAYAYDGTGWFTSPGASILFRAEGGQSATNHGQEIDFFVTERDATLPFRRMSLLNTGELQMTQPVYPNSSIIHISSGGTFTTDVGFLFNNSNGELSLPGFTRMTPLNSPPVGPTSGTLYMDDGTCCGGTPTLRYYNGTIWINL